MITRFNEPCFVLVMNDREFHYETAERAAAVLRSKIDEARQYGDADELKRAERLVVEQNRQTCGVLTCDGCGTEYEDDEDGGHLTDVAEDQAAIAAAVASGWTRDNGDTVHCPACPKLTRSEPGPDDVPLPILAPATGPMPKPPPLERRTKRRYAHDLYPHPDEWQTRKLDVEMPYLYAQAIGHEVHGTGWFELRGSADELRQSVERTMDMVRCRQIARLADALHQGMTGDAAWEYADAASWDYEGELTYDRAKHYGVEIEKIKPYPCGPEPDKHDHYGEPDAEGFRRVTTIRCKESECPDCMEEIPAPGPGEEPLPIAGLAG
jgi:hypothetical protein